MDTKVCTVCRLEKPIEEFPWKKRWSGKRHSRCKTCTAQDSGTWYAENKDHHKETVKVNTKRAKQAAREYVYQYFLTHPCEGILPDGSPCRESDPTVLEFHHLGEKDREIGRMISLAYSTPSIAAEISRCQVLCSNCHKRLTAKERGWFKGRGR